MKHERKVYENECGCQVSEEYTFCAKHARERAKDDWKIWCPSCGKRKGAGPHYCTARCGWCHQEKGYEHHCSGMAESMRTWEVYT